MVDMTICTSELCNIKDRCYRATAKPNPLCQSYYNFEYECHKNSGFEYYIKQNKKGNFAD